MDKLPKLHNTYREALRKIVRIGDNPDCDTDDLLRAVEIARKALGEDDES